MDSTTEPYYLQERNEYYKKRYIQYEILKQLNQKELIIKDEKPPTRYLHGGTENLLNQSLNAMNFYNKIKSNIYHSIAIIKPTSIPLITFNMKKRGQESKTLTQKIRQDYLTNNNNYLIGYDFAIDIDYTPPAKDITIEQIGEQKEHTESITKEGLEKARNETITICKEFDKYQIPYTTKFSGKKGFHIEIKKDIHETTNTPENINKTIKTYKTFVEKLSIIHNLKYIDHTIYDPRRFLKTAYTIVNIEKGKQKGNYITLPLNQTQLETYTHQDLQIQNIMKKIPLYNRGLLTRKGETKNLNKIIKDYNTTK